MLYGFLILVHILVSFVLIGVILLQGGRGGLAETMGGAAAQSLFGGSAVTVLTKITASCAGIFVITCLSLAVLSTARGRSIMEQMPFVAPDALPSALPPPAARAEPTPAPAQAEQPVEPPVAPEPTTP